MLLYRGPTDEPSSVSATQRLDLNINIYYNSNYEMFLWRTEIMTGSAPMTPEEFHGLIEKYIAPFTVMLAVTKGQNPSPDQIICNGTGALVATGGGEFLVTNHHVYEAFLDAREKDHDAILIMSGAHGTKFLDNSSAVVTGRDKDVDLTVLRMPARYVINQGKMLMPHIPWPPRRPEPGMMAVVYGYPGQGRVTEGPTVLGVRAVSIGLPIASVSDRHFVLVDEGDEPSVLVPPGQNVLTSFGGVSGSAVYVLVESTESTEGELYLGGFIYEANDSGMFFATHADHINADGAVR
jgi:hypothetical protein